MDRNVRIVGVPMDLGADRRGVDMGPSAIRYAGLAEEIEGLNVACTDWGDVHVPRPEGSDPDAGTPDTGDAKFLGETETVCTRLAHEVADTVEEGDVPLVLGGDHSIAVGTAGGVSREAETGILWFDAHGDFNTPATTPSGNVHGMSLAAILGKGIFADTDWAPAPNVSEENVALVGLRSVDEGERENIRESDVTAYTMTDVDARGVTEVVTEALDIASDGTDGVHVSLDLDWLDPTEAPGVGTPVRGGVSYREAHAAMELIAERTAEAGRLSSMELVEVNPILDQHNQTAELAVELAASALGKVIL
ncbi:arginase [Halorientalis sp. IM1011]|uniref:arginase n=1 Tax=Halorientalis sp. IM1011 TaxID=1932360 RepID=UPI00097CCE58|nr:arginase [Halorientalis sp. IM1011]AQL41338.1 arginase [Halorientalis sp. IM1011]